MSAYSKKFKVDFLENKASNEKFLFYIFDLFFRVESRHFRLYYQLPTILYIYVELSLELGAYNDLLLNWPSLVCTINDILLIQM